jgi:hypothetical protein
MSIGEIAVGGAIDVLAAFLNSGKKDDCPIAKKGETDSDKSKFSTIWQIAALALTAAATAVSSKMLTKQMEIAKQYLSISKSWRSWYKSGFAPLEDMELAEVKANQPTVPYYDAAVGRARALIRVRMDQKADMERAIRCTTQYQTGARQKILYLGMKQQAQNLATMSTMARKQERSRCLILDEWKWNLALQALNRGHDLQSQNARMGALAGSIFGDLAAGAAEGSAYFLGYALNKRETNYPVRQKEDTLTRQNRAASTGAPYTGQSGLTNQSGLNRPQMVP